MVKRARISFEYLAYSTVRGCCLMLTDDEKFLPRIPSQCRNIPKRESLAKLSLKCNPSVRKLFLPPTAGPAPPTRQKMINGERRRRRRTKGTSSSCLPACAVAVPSVPKRPPTISRKLGRISRRMQGMSSAAAGAEQTQQRQVSFSPSVPSPSLRAFCESCWHRTILLNQN